MCKTRIYILLISLIIPLRTVNGGSLPWPDFESGWLPIRNGLEHVARLNIEHGLVEIPLLVDVSVKINENIFPASGFRPDHPKERSGPVVYIYDAIYVNVSTSPVEDPLYSINRHYKGAIENVIGDAHVRVRAWKQSSLPVVNFQQTGIQMKANSSKVSDSYAEMSHNLNEMPCLVVARVKMYNDQKLIVADGVGSSMQVYKGVFDRTNAYLVYGYSNSTMRMWVDSSSLGAIFDGRKHTWFNMVISEGEAEIFAWKCSTITPVYNARVETTKTRDKLPSQCNIDVQYELEASLIRVSVLAEKLEGANVGFRFPAGMYLGYLEPNETEINGDIVSATNAGGLSYTYNFINDYNNVNFWQPRYYENFSLVFIAESFGNGKNTEVSHSESVYILSWIFKENAGCPVPVIPNGFANSSHSGTSTGSHAIVHCDEGFYLKAKKKYYNYDHERNIITCHKYGYWENIPSCLPKEKELESECNPSIDRCRDQHANCVLTSDRRRYRCTCNTGYRNENGRCKAKGIYLPAADYDSGWTFINMGRTKWHLEFEHGFGTVPAIVDVQVEVKGFILHAVGFPPGRLRLITDGESTVVYIYDEHFVNVSTLKAHGGYSNHDRLFSISNDKWYGYPYSWPNNGHVRVRAWKADSLPVPDIFDDTKILRANTSTASDSFYELEHNLGEYPGIVVVRAKMEYNGSFFYANGVGSALNIFSAKDNRTNAYLVYGYSDLKIRAWVDSSTNGAIFDGRRDTYFNMIVSEAVLEAYAWKLSTITPFFTYMFPLDDDRIPPAVELLMNYDLGDSLTLTTAQIMDASSQNKDFRFPSSAFLADRHVNNENNTTGPQCIFGGFTAAYKKGSSSLRNQEIDVLLFKPIDYKHPHEDFGALLCLPDSFGRGTYSGASHNGIGTLHSWINGDCGDPPEEANGYVNTSVNGTEFGAVASMECDDGYTVSYGNQPFCDGSAHWKVSVKCDLVECGQVKAPVFGTMNGSDVTFGSCVTFQCFDGFKLNGTDKICCLSTGSWSSSVPTCYEDTGDEDSGKKGKISKSNRGSGNIIVIVLSISLTRLLSSIYGYLVK